MITCGHRVSQSGIALPGTVPDLEQCVATMGDAYDRPGSLLR